MEITTTCKICEQKFTYERKRNKSKTPYTRKCCDTCRTSENKKRATYATKKKQCKTIDTDMKLLKLIHELEKNEEYMKLDRAQHIKKLAKEMNYTYSGMRAKTQVMIELDMIDITKHGGYCLTLTGILMIKYEGKED